MRQAIGTTWIMQLVIIFMLIFVAFVALTINYTKAFKMKNELITFVEKNEGISEREDGTLDLINNYLEYNGYSVRGGCPEGSYGIDNLNDPVLKEAQDGERYYYCIQKIPTAGPSTMERARYHVTIFFHFSLPIIGDIFTFSVDGETVDITNPVDSL